MNFQYHPLGEAQLDQILALYRQCEDFLSLGPNPHASREMVLADLALSRDNGGEFSGIFIGEELAGVLDLIPSGYEGDPQTAFLELLMIAPAWRGQGLGERVLETAQERLRAAGIRTFKAGVQVNNPGAVRFWTRHGFRIVSEPKLLPDGTTCVDLLKDI
jgi:ribosomal protein S18 acetylase RimI-like enzyme